MIISNINPSVLLCRHERELSTLDAAIKRISHNLGKLRELTYLTARRDRVEGYVRALQLKMREE